MFTAKMYKMYRSIMMLYVLLIWDPSFYLCYIYSIDLCFDILKNHKIIGYFRYVDDILMVYKENKTNIQEVFEAFKDMSPTLQFTY